jgi:hypothetical protein
VFVELHRDLVLDETQRGFEAAVGFHTEGCAREEAFDLRGGPRRVDRLVHYEPEAADPIVLRRERQGIGARQDGDAVSAGVLEMSGSP